MTDQTQDQEFVEFIVKAIVDNPDDVSTEQTEDDMGTLISLHVSAADMGTIIGKEGRTAKALRTLLRVFGAKNNARVNLKIIEPEGGRPSYLDNETPAELPVNNFHEALKDIPQDELA